VRKRVMLVGAVVATMVGLLCVRRSFALHPVAAKASNQEESLVGKRAPDFQLKMLEANGRTLQLSRLKGKSVVINFWATWCEPCKVEMPWLADLQKKYGPKRLQVIGIAMDDADEETITNFAHDMGVNYPVLIGTDQVAELYGGVESLPATFFINRSGRIVVHQVGLVSLHTFEKNIRISLTPARPPKTKRPPAASR